MKRRPRMLLMVLLLLTGGAIINVAVAWGSCLGSWNSQVDWIYQGDSRLEQCARQLGLPFDLVETSVAPVEELTIALGVRRFRLIYGDNPYHSDLIVTAGLPTAGLFGTQREKQGIVVSQRGIATFERAQEFREVPFHPLWPGFAINTIFYAAILWLLFAAPGFVKRRIRTRRGQCPACAYPVGASNVCTECGRPVTPPAL